VAVVEWKREMPIPGKGKESFETAGWNGILFRILPETSRSLQASDGEGKKGWWMVIVL
jgi:hypothetical protein